VIFSWSNATSSWWIAFLEIRWIAEKGQHSFLSLSFGPVRRSQIRRHFGLLSNGFFPWSIVCVYFIDCENAAPWVISDIPITSVDWTFHS
jgi:hypothetical protein